MLPHADVCCRMLTEQGEAAAQKQQVASDAAAFLAQLKSLQAQADAPAIVQGMRAHSENAAVQQQACAALSSLAIKDENQVTTAAAGGIGAVLEGMKAHKDSAGVQDAACDALWMLACNGDNRVTIAVAGGIELVLQGMKAHTDIANVQQQACAALQMFALSNGDNAVTIAAAGGIEAIAAAMTAHKGSADVQEAACSALHDLAGYPGLRERIKAAGCVELAKRTVSASNATKYTKIFGEALIDKLA
jgi:hypothetical protein